MRERIVGRFEFGSRTQIRFKSAGAVSKTQQHFAKEADVNEIVRRAERTGVLGDPLRPGMPRQVLYGDFTRVPDFHTMQVTVRKVNEEFIRLPAKLRDRFGNSPEAFLSFLQDPANLKEAVGLGLLPVELLPVEVPNAPDPVPASPVGGSGSVGQPTGQPGTPGASSGVVAGSPASPAVRP